MWCIDRARIKLSVWWFTNVGKGYYGYQVFSWWIVDSRERVPAEACQMLKCTEIGHIGPHHILMKD